MGDVLLLETGTDKFLLEVGSSFVLLEVPDDSYKQLILGTAGLVSYWRLGESVGTNAVDEKAANAGTYVDNGVGSITYGLSGLIAGSGNTSIKLNATAHWITVNGVASLFVGTASWTIEQWSNHVVDANFPNLFSARDVAGTSIVNIATNATNLFVSINSVDTITTTPLSSVTHYTVLTYDGTNLRWYVDGALVAGPTAATIGATAKTDATIGGQGGAGIVASFDEVAVYNIELSAQQVRDHYNYGIGTARWFRPPQPVLQAINRAAVR